LGEGSLGEYIFWFRDAYAIVLCIRAGCQKVCFGILS
jgi:hypothetical protein